MDPRGLPGNLLVLYGRVAGRTRIAASVRARGNGDRRNGARSDLRWLADLLHQPHFPINQRQPHRRSNCTRNRAGHRRTHALPARPVPIAGSILNRRSGYIRYIDIHRLVALAKAYRICVYLERRVGQFVPAGVPLARVSKPERVAADHAIHLGAAFDIGPTRTMQQDVEFGIIQIVDIALRAMSPAVDDPSTAISCVDQLSRIIIIWIGRMPPLSHYYAPPHVLRLFVPWMSFDGLLDTAFEQIRHYAAADIAVSLRLMRAFYDIASATEHADLRTRLLERGRRVMDGCAGHLPKDELVKLQQRLATLEEVTAAAG